ncbi:MAG: hypothetical protein RL333_583 [Pseudomonadota bacterium]
MVEGGSNELDDVTPRQYAHASNPLKVLSDRVDITGAHVKRCRLPSGSTEKSS